MKIRIICNSYIRHKIPRKLWKWLCCIELFLHSFYKSLQIFFVAIFLLRSLLTKKVTLYLKVHTYELG
jgi:hypothetical protein